jgi:hypothetical protein
MELPRIIINSGAGFIALTVLIALLRFRYLHGAMKTMAYYAFLGGTVQCYASYLSNNKINNLYLLHLYTPLEFACILWFYSILLRGFIPQKVFLYLAFGFVTFSALNSLFIQDLKTFNTYARSLEGVLVIVLSLLWFYQTLIEMKIKKLEEEPVFWVNAGFLLYFSGNVLLFAFSNYIMNINNSLNSYIWAFHALFSILVYLLIAVGLWKTR